MKMAENVQGTSETITTKSGKTLVFAASGLERKEEMERVGAYKDIHTESGNRFRMLQQLSLTTPHVFIPLLKLSLSLVKGVRFESEKGTENDALKKDFEKWAKRINFQNQVQTISRLLVRDGTFCALPTGKPDGSDLSIQPFLMEHVTLLPKGVKPGVVDNTILLQPPIETLVVDEGGAAPEGTEITPKEQTYPFKNVIYGAFCPWDYVIMDWKNRQTFGMYGISLLEPIRDTTYKYLELVEGYCKYIKKYGIGRYHIDYTVLEEIIKEGDVDAALDALQKLSDKHKYIKENEDIVGVGFKVKELNTGGSNINVVQFKQSMEKDIQIGLLQQPLTMGMAEGTTFAAGYVSESDRMVALEGMQMLIQNIINQGIIDLRLQRMGKEPGTIWVEFEELSRADIAFKDFLALSDREGCTEQEARVRAGLPAKKPEGALLKPVQTSNQFEKEKPSKKPSEESEE
jgi:hypothetical protein